ncbi:MAG: fumarylacetoacetate hydrolase family protein [Halodesulfurarchaeum sp.]
MTRLARRADGRPLLGDDNGFVPLSAAEPDVGSVREALGRATVDGLSTAGATASPVLTANVHFSTPLADPGKLWGVGLNYAAHAEDLDENRPDEPASFMKPASTVVGPGGPIRLPPKHQTERVTAEAEWGVVIGRTAKDVTVEEASAVVAGYVPVIDLTAEDVLERNPRFLTRAKSFDTFLILGPWIETDAPDVLGDVEVRTVVNGSVAARNVVSNMQFSPLDLVSFHSRVMTLEPGDVISTGTPGAAAVRNGDEVRAEVDGIGTLRADVVGPE